MKNIISPISLILTIGMFVISCSATKHIASDNPKPYIPVSQALYDTIMRMDSIVFDAANKGEIDKMKALFTEDLEFYHDAGGLDGYAKTMENFQRVATNYGYTRRVLLKESVEVYPIKDYGAIQTGLHKFCRLEKGELINCGTFKFLHIWKKTPTGWKISRVVSYGH
ncbi:MAG: nuclear transport factor 2 family protein [Methylococcaceae bacterium]|nr:nuclear transport factor 2 family protein [Prolixibacteraceae bacterium]